MTILCFISLILVLSRVINPFNVDLISPYILRTDDDGMFGFSVSIHENDDGKYLLVGAPKAQTQQAGIDKGGAVYKCKVPENIGDPDDAVACNEQIELDEYGDRYTYFSAEPDDFQYEESEVYNIQMESKSNQWMGVTVHSDLYNNYIISCAHRYEARYLIIRKEIYDPPRQLIGRCIILANDFYVQTEYTPCLDRDSGYVLYGYCQAGTSAAVINNTAVLGAAGCQKGYGCMMAYDMTDPGDQFTETKDQKIGDPDYGGLRDYPYNGYTTIVCDLNGDGILDIISGGPRGEYYKGKVTIFNHNDMAKTVNLPSGVELKGEQFGSYYGHSLVCTDLNGDGNPDLVVGAPWYTPYFSSGTKPDTGRIYMYTGERDFYISNSVNTIRIDGQSSNEAFGFSMAGAGDIDHDGYGDLFVGAPYYNNGEGRIYLYLGSKDGIITTPSQVISPSQIGLNKPLKGFGWSISSQKDVDGNSYNDVLIGSWKSNHAVLLRSIKIVDVKAEIKFNNSEIHPKEGEVKAPDGTLVPGTHFQACFRYIGEEAADSNNKISIDFKVELDVGESVSRLHTVYQNTSSKYYTKTMDIDTTNTTFCTDSIPLYYTIDSFNVDPIKVTLAADLVQASELPFDKRAVLNQRYVNSAATTVNIGYECPQDTRVCSANMSLKIDPVSYEGQDLYPLVIGKVDTITLPVTITNNGPDFAYGTALHVQIPSKLTFVENSKCAINQTTQPGKYYTLLCELQEPLIPQNFKSWNLQFNISHLHAPIKDTVTAKAIVREPSVEVNADSAISVVIIDIENLADLKLRGGTSGKRVPFNNKFTIADKTYEKTISGYEGPLVIHTYEVYHASESYNRHVENITLEILWPERFPNGAPLFPLKSFKYGMYPNGGNKTIHCNNTVVTDKIGIIDTFLLEPPEDKYPAINCLTNVSLCTKLTCTIESIERGGRAKFSLFSNVQEYVLYDFDNLTVTSATKILSVEKDMVLPSTVHTSASATTILYSSKFKRRNLLWIIIIAIICGLVLLGLIIIILWKRGFFKRFKPEPEPTYTVGYTVDYDEQDTVHLAK